MRHGLLIACAILVLGGQSAPAPLKAADATLAARAEQLFRRENLVAWCIVPFDAAKRTPAQRAQLLAELGLKRCAYDWRAEHVPQFEEEIQQYQKHGIEFFAFWGAHDAAFALFEKYQLHPQIWQTAPSPNAETDAACVEAAANSLKPLAERTRTLGFPLGLYNHGGWGGEPKKLVAVCRKLRELGYPHVGIVYNFHHGHEHIDDWKESLALLQPYLLCLNINGMNRGAQPKILGVSQGEFELAMLKTLAESGYAGPIGILNHRTEVDARDGLLENLEGLDWARKELIQPGSGGAKPRPRTIAVAAPPTAKSLPVADTHAHDNTPAASPPASLLPYDPQFVAALAAEAQQQGDARAGAAIFASARSACLACHKIGAAGGAVGPELTAIGKQRDVKQLVESVFWPKREVKPEFVSWTIITAEGKTLTGYKQPSDDKSVVLRNPALGDVHSIPRSEIEEEVAVGTLMPDGLMSPLSRQQQLDVVRFLASLGADDSASLQELQRLVAEAAAHAPQKFNYDLAPLVPADHPLASLPVNAPRLYDFYARQAEHFRGKQPVPKLLADYPGLDNNVFGHWGKQVESDWAETRWQESDSAGLQCGVLQIKGVTAPRGVFVRLGEQGELAACFDPDTLTYRALWSGGFINFSPVRHGFMSGPSPAGPLLPLPEQTPPSAPFKYHGFYRDGQRTVFAYRRGDVEYLDAPGVKNGQFVREVAPVEQHPLRSILSGGAPRWPQTLETAINPGAGRPYAIDTIEVPFANPWKALMYFGGFDFLPDGSALLCTMQGDVWRVTGLDAPADKPGRAAWRRFASGLHHPQGLVVSRGEIFVLGRNQLTRLHDLNHDGEADFYECFSSAYETSAAGHDFICGLERDAEGNFYTVSGNQGLVKISADGSSAQVCATGFRNPDGLGLLPDGTVTVPCSEGEWTPASMVCAVRNQPGLCGVAPPHFGYRGPKNDQPPQLPFVYLPRGVDNSAGGQTWVSSDRWGLLQNQIVHFSFGTGMHFLLLKDEVQGQLQGAAVPLPGDFRAGAHRGRFRPQDGQLYVAGMGGWTTYTPDDGSFQRVRYTGDPVQLPVGWHVHENGVSVTFSAPVSRSLAEQPGSHFAQCWNYRYSAGYGSPELSPSHPGTRGHDPLRITSVHVQPDGRTLFLELPDLQPVNQLHLRLHVDDSGRGHDLFATVNRLGAPFTAFPGYQPVAKVIAAHPLLADLALAKKVIPNPWRRMNSSARKIQIETGKNLTYATTQLTAKAGEALAVTLSNPDVVPHNWALVKPGALQRVGEAANRLIADPEAFLRQYVPETDDVLVYTDIVPPQEETAIYFKAPKEPGRYPYLCTFPGHWMVMNGVLVVE